MALSLYKHSDCLFKHSYNLYMHSHGLYKHSVVRSCQLFFKIYIFTAHIVQKKFLNGHERAFRGHESAFRGRGSAFRGCESVCRGLCDVNKIETISKLRIETKPKHVDVLQNLKWNVSSYSKNFGTKPKLFDVFQLFFAKAKRFFYSKNFGTKPKLFDVFQLFFSKSKTLLFNPKILEQNQNVLIKFTNF